MAEHAFVGQRMKLGQPIRNSAAIDRRIILKLVQEVVPGEPAVGYLLAGNHRLGLRLDLMGDFDLSHHTGVELDRFELLAKRRESRT